MPERPYDLEKYIASQQNDACQGNNADFKPTYRRELDEIEARCVEEYARGQELIATISDQERARCKKLYVHKRGNAYEMSTLSHVWIGKKRALVPAHIALIGEVRELAEIFA